MQLPDLPVDSLALGPQPIPVPLGLLNFRLQLSQLPRRLLILVFLLSPSLLLLFSFLSCILHLGQV